jgi:hypothetical protein
MWAVLDAQKVPPAKGRNEESGKVTVQKGLEL